MISYGVQRVTVKQLSDFKGLERLHAERRVPHSASLNHSVCHCHCIHISPLNFYSELYNLIPFASSGSSWSLRVTCGNVSVVRIDDPSLPFRSERQIDYRFAIYTNHHISTFSFVLGVHITTCTCVLYPSLPYKLKAKFEL